MKLGMMVYTDKRKAKFAIQKKLEVSRSQGLKKCCKKEQFQAVIKISQKGLD